MSSFSFQQIGTIHSPWKEKFAVPRQPGLIADGGGELRLLANKRLSWHGQEWLLVKQPWMPRYGILLTLQPTQGKKRRRLWLASDSMGKAEWRHLRQLLLHPSADDDEEP